MITLLARLFIKDYKNYEDVTVRRKYGELCGGFGIFLNLLLFIGKLLAGILTMSISIIADAFNNLSDAAGSIVQIIGFKLSSKKPDPEHPFGHGRFEYIAGLIISFLILLMGFELLKNSVQAIIHPKSIEFTLIALIILIASVLVKFYMMIYNLSVSKKINSVAVRATAMDSLYDVISTFLVIVSFILSRFISLPVDGIAGVIVSCFVLYGGFSSVKETLDPLLGLAPSKEFVKEIEAEVHNHKLFLGMHDLVVHDYGPGRLMISFHAEVPGDQDIFALHDAIDILEVDIARKFNCHVVVHMDPIDTHNTRLAELRDILSEQLKLINLELNAHDVRMVPGPTHTNLIFDVVKPFSLNMEDDELIRLIQVTMYNLVPNLFCVVTIDLPMA